MSKLASKLSPTNGYAVIQPDTTETKTTGIVIKKEKKDYYQFGTILKIGGKVPVGDGVVLEPPAEIDDTVLYAYADHEAITKEGETIQIVKFNAIVSVYGKN